MNDTPGWASPGSAPSDEPESGAAGPAEPADQPGPRQFAEQPGAEPHAPGPKWSKDQPPPGQWSAPTGTTPDQSQGYAAPPPPGPGQGGSAGGGYGGPGGYGVWGGGWGGPPPAAKPGVIPLRPLGVGEILDGAVSTMRAYWRTVLGISLTVAVITETLVVLMQAFVMHEGASRETLGNPGAGFNDMARVMGEFAAGFGLVAVISMIGTVVATALLTTVTSRAVLGKSVSIGEAWRDARPQLLKLFGLVFLLPLIGIGVMCGGMLPGILLAVGGVKGLGVTLMVLGFFASFAVTLWLMIRFSLASPALMLEKQGILKSISRSAKLVRGSWWRVFGIQLLAALITGILAWIIATVFMVFAALLSGGAVSGALGSSTGPFSWTVLIVSGIGSVIGSTITFPVTAGVTVLLYVDQRIRREALDLELTRAAGAEGYGIGTITGS